MLIDTPNNSFTILKFITHVNKVFLKIQKKMSLDHIEVVEDLLRMLIAVVLIYIYEQANTNYK